MHLLLPPLSLLLLLLLLPEAEKGRRCFSRRRRSGRCGPHEVGLGRVQPGLLARPPPPAALPNVFKAVLESARVQWRESRRLQHLHDTGSIFRADVVSNAPWRKTGREAGRREGESKFDFFFPELKSMRCASFLFSSSPGPHLPFTALHCFDDLYASMIKALAPTAA